MENYYHLFWDRGSFSTKESYKIFNQEIKEVSQKIIA